MTKDQEAIRLLSLDYFFIMFDVLVSQDYAFNAVSGSKEEVAFKESISEAVLEHDFMPSV